jgi:catechol 2,3-dioxygenase-like lactoylglutathione lyase family enzyme
MYFGYDGRPPSVCRCRGFYCSLHSFEVVLVSVSDVDRAKTFYAEMVGFHVDFDSPISEEVRVVQLTPPGSGCSIQVGKGITDMPPGSLGDLQLVVPDLVAARAELVGQGAETTEIQVYSEDGLRPRREGESLDNVEFVYFDDPDGNGWTVQQISSRG